VTFKATINEQSLKIAAAAPEPVNSCGEEFLYWDQGVFRLVISLSRWWRHR
jgi:hypothetical protein